MAAFGGQLCLSAEFDSRASALLATLQSPVHDEKEEPPCRGEERVVIVGEEPMRKAALRKAPPASLNAVSGGEDELRLYTVDALRKLAKKEGVDLGKASSRDSIIQVLMISRL